MRAARRRRRTSHPPGTSQDPSRPRRRNPPQSPSQAPVHPHLQNMSPPRVTNQVPPVRPPPSPQVLPPRLHPPPQSPRSRPEKERALTRQKCPSPRPLLKRRRAGSHHCHLRQAAGSPRFERPRGAVLRRRSVLLRTDGRNRREVGRGQVGAREAEEARPLKRNPEASLSSKNSLCSYCGTALSSFFDRIA